MTNQGNGLANDLDGSLLMCEHVSRSVVRIRPNGELAPIAERWNNLQFNSPNDLVVRRDGTIYFTDPPYALNAQRTRQIPFNGLFRITTTGSVAVEARFDRGAGEGMMSATLPNGIELSPDERTLYVADSATGIVWRWDVNTDGSLANQREFVRTEGMAPDGITVDVDANVYIASAIGIEVYRPDATRWGVIRGWPPNVRPANMAFGGPNMDYLLVAAERNAYFLQLRARGLRR
jgi:gluconolactonase